MEGHSAGLVSALVKKREGGGLRWGTVKEKRFKESPTQQDQRWQQLQNEGTGDSQDGSGQSRVSNTGDRGPKK